MHSLSPPQQDSAEDLTTHSLTVNNEETRTHHVSGASNIHCDDEMLEVRCNLELRKDLIIESHATYVNDAHQVEEEGIFKSEPETALELDVNALHHHQQQSYMTLTSLPSISLTTESIDVPSSDNNLVSNISNLFSINPSSCWMSSQHEESNYLNSNYNYLSNSSSCHYQRNTPEISNQTEFGHHMVMVENPFKQSLPMGPNPLYHLDTNNRRIWY